MRKMRDKNLIGTNCVFLLLSIAIYYDSNIDIPCKENRSVHKVNNTPYTFIYNSLSAV